MAEHLAAPCRELEETCSREQTTLAAARASADELAALTE
jgi:hypothetical protein